MQSIKQTEKKMYDSLNILDKEFNKEAERTDSEKKMHKFPKNKNND